MVYNKFTVITYPSGRGGTPKLRWFYAERYIEWATARDRLVEAGVIDRDLAGRTYEAGGWMISVDATDYSAQFAEPLPPA